MADRKIQLIDKDDENIYPLGHCLDDYILALPDYTDVEKIEDMQGATATTDGKHGLVPKPLSADRNKVLQGDGKWETYPVGTVLVVMEYSAALTNPVTTGSWQPIGGTWRQYGRMANGTSSEAKITPPADEDWVILVEYYTPHCLLQYGSSNTDCWGGPALGYRRSGGTNGVMATWIRTRRGMSSSNSTHWADKLVKQGLCTHGQDTYIIPGYVNGRSGSDSSFSMVYNPGNWAVGTTCIVKITLVEKRKV